MIDDFEDIGELERLEIELDLWKSAAEMWRRIYQLEAADCDLICARARDLVTEAIDQPALVGERCAAKLKLLFDAVDGTVLPEDVAEAKRVLREAP